MIVADLIVTATKATVTKRAPITAGLLGAEIAIKAAADWEDLIVNVTFQGAEERTILNVKDKVFIPPEVVATPYLPLRIGVVGVSDNVTNEEVIPTLWADMGTIAPGATFNADEAVPNVPGTPSPWAQLLAMIGDVEELKTEDRANLVAAVNEVYGKVGDNTDLATKLEKALADISDLKSFHPIEIKSVSNNVGTKELGESVNAVTVSWVLNKTPASQTVDGKAVGAADRSAVIPGPFTSGKSFVVTATDAEGNTASNSTNIAFYNGVYYGVLPAEGDISREDILAMNRKLQSGRGVTFTATPGSGKRPAYACPSRYGTPKFVIGGFEYSWTKLGTIDFTNASGYMEKYDIWQHPQDVTGSMTITVS